MRDKTASRVRDHLIVALDLETRREALDLVERLGDRVDRYKVGPTMFTRYGPPLLDDLAELGAELFVDLKFHDIPNTVAGAVEAVAGREDVFLMTVHASGGREMIAEAARAAGPDGPEIVAVTALTSLDARDVRAVAGATTIDAWAGRLADLALEAGADGLVCSALEAPDFRQAHGAEPTLVTPGIRLADDERGDQKRVVTPGQALEAGSDYLVMGRSIYGADDPVAAVEAVGRSIAR
jgi:orotidine-5'-phosphate decarboxylase